MISIQTLAFYSAIFFTVVGAILGLLGVWIDGFWKDDIGPKLLMTDVIFAVTSIIVAAIARWLG